MSCKVRNVVGNGIWEFGGCRALKSLTFSGENGVALQDYAPFGVIGAITPVTHSLPTLACNAINMLAAGNAVVINPHPSGAKIACKGIPSHRGQSAASGGCWAKLTKK